MDARDARQTIQGTAATSRTRFLHLERFHARLLELVEELLTRGTGPVAYQRLCEAAVAVIPGVEAGSLLVRNDDGRFGFAGAVNFDRDRLEGIEFAPGELGRDLTDHEPCLIYGFDNSELDPETQVSLETSGRVDEIQVTLSIPVVADGEAVAYFNLDSFRDRDAFGREAIDMARIFASLVSALWNRLRLERELEFEREKYRRLAFHDDLTGLPNRSLLVDRIEQQMRQAERSGRPMAVMFLDLDEFKEINDLRGHDCGDRFLVAVADRLQWIVRSNDTVARWGGDEFVVVLGDLDDAEDAALVARKIHDAVNEPVRLDGQTIHPSVSIGIDVYPGEGRSVGDLIKHADTALYRAKAQGKNRHAFFTRSMNDHLAERLELETDLRDALVEGAIELHYQPRVTLRNRTLASFEALARWTHPLKGRISPGRFIPVAEASDLILKLGAYVLDRACAQARQWQRSGTPYRVAVNLSARQLRHPDVVEQVRDALDRHRLDPNLLELEITESAAMADVGASIERLAALRALGVTLSLDDFGTAYSSLGYLRRFPLHSLKIDQSFIQRIGANPQDTPHETSIARAILALGKSLNLTVVAEGIETQSQYRFLWLEGCEQGQGYLFARPQPPEALTELLTRGRLES